MHHGIEMFLGKKPGDQLAIADIAADEAIGIPLLYPFEVFQVPGIGQFIEVDHPPSIVPAVQQPDKIGADETAASGHQDLPFIFHRSFLCLHYRKKNISYSLFFCLFL